MTIEQQLDVLQVVSSTASRGAEVFARDLGEALKDVALRVRTVALAPGVPGHVLELPVLGRRRMSIETLRELRREARRASIVIAHGSTALPACAIATIGLGVPFVYRSIGDPEYWNRTWLRRSRSRLLLRRSARVVALSERARGSLEWLGVPHARLEVIPNGVDARRFPPVDEAARRRARSAAQIDLHARVVAYVGALSPEKNVATAIRAVATLPGVEFVVAGDGVERQALEGLARRLLGTRAHFLGHVEDVAFVYAASDVAVLPSSTEGLPAMLIEAGLSGVPVVATDVGFVRDIVLDNRTGFLVTPGDAVGLAEAIDRALQSRDALGNAAISWCTDHFDLQGVATAWVALLKDVERGR